jgi:anti-sigma regulatory factor (Ser/Thr protein kinase)
MTLPAVASFEAHPSCASEARRFVVSAVRDWDIQELVDDAATCTTELATNAILHSRTDFAVSVRPTPDGVRIDVQDDRPDRIPVVVPEGLAPLDTGTTGRGLILIAAIAGRWGYFTTDIAKTVWAELAPNGSVELSPPVVELAQRDEVPPTGLVHLIGVPTGAAIASGVQVDEVVRELQLDAGVLSELEREQFLALLERTAAVRLAGRHAAFRAAAANRASYTIDYPAGADDMAALMELAVLLARLSSDGRIVTATVGDDVLAMRAWINQQAQLQLAGGEPTPYPGS